VGWDEGILEGRLMTAVEISNHLLQNCDAFSEFSAYMFGSTLYGVGSDIDILIVGPSGASLSRLKRQLAVAGRNLPLDILIMQPSEAEETRFIKKEQCVLLSKIAISDP